MRASLLAALLASATMAGAGDPLVFEENFSDGLERWEVLDPATWRHNAGGTVEITARGSAYMPPHRSPGHVALVKDLRVGNAAIEFRVKSTKDTGDHRDCCVFFGWKNPAHFYYVHLGAKPDPHSGQIMIVDGADRHAITRNKKRVPWDGGWHTVRLERNTKTGRIAVYFDDLTKPLIEAVDTTFATGRVGIGSFDDMNVFDEVRVWETAPAKTQPTE